MGRVDIPSIYSFRLLSPARWLVSLSIHPARFYEYTAPHSSPSLFNTEKSWEGEADTYENFLLPITAQGIVPHLLPLQTLLISKSFPLIPLISRLVMSICCSRGSQQSFPARTDIREMKEHDDSESISTSLDSK